MTDHRCEMRSGISIRGQICPFVRRFICSSVSLLLAHRCAIFGLSLIQMTARARYVQILPVLPQDWRSVVTSPSPSVSTFYQHIVLLTPYKLGTIQPSVAAKTTFKSMVWVPRDMLGEMKCEFCIKFKSQKVQFTYASPSCLRVKYEI